MMQCNTVRPLLADHLVGALGFFAARRVTKHVALCPVCQREAEGHRRVVLLLNAMPPDSPPPGLWESIERQLHAPAMTVERRLPRTLIWGLPAGVAASIAAFSLAVSRPPPPILPGADAQVAPFVEQAAYFSRREALSNPVQTGWLVTLAARQSEADGSSLQAQR